MTATEIIAEPGVPQIIVLREFDTSPQVLFRAHTEPALLVQWLGPGSLVTTVDRLEPRDGGRWRYTQTDARGVGHFFHGLFHGDPTPDQIVQTYEFEEQPGRVQLNTVTLEPRGGRTLLRQNTLFQSVEDRDGYVRAGMERGVHASMANLDALVTKLHTEEGR
jgi:uncharacterized protein YndB with AHSA1/START domain